MGCCVRARAFVNVSVDLNVDEQMPTVGATRLEDGPLFPPKTTSHLVGTWGCRRVGK